MWRIEVGFLGGGVIAFHVCLLVKECRLYRDAVVFNLLLL